MMTTDRILLGGNQKKSRLWGGEPPMSENPLTKVLDTYKLNLL